jgi:hypothetical protein
MRRKMQMVITYLLSKRSLVVSDLFLNLITGANGQSRQRWKLHSRITVQDKKWRLTWTVISGVDLPICQYMVVQSLLKSLDKYSVQGKCSRIPTLYVSYLYPANGTDNKGDDWLDSTLLLLRLEWIWLWWLLFVFASTKRRMIRRTKPRGIRVRARGRVKGFTSSRYTRLL